MISCWNCGGIYGNYKYAKTILNQVDIMAISEHWLYEDELSFLNELNNEFGCYAKSVLKITLIIVGAEAKVGWHCFGIKAKFRYKRSI